MFEPPERKTVDLTKPRTQEEWDRTIAEIRAATERCVQVRDLGYLCGSARVHIASIKDDSQTSPQLTYLAQRAEEELLSFDEYHTLLRSDGNQHLVASCLFATDQQYRESWTTERLRVLDRLAVAAFKLGAIAQLMETEEFMAHNGWFTTTQAAAYLHVTPARISQLVKDGKLRTNRMKRKKIRIDARSVIEYDRVRLDPRQTPEELARQLKVKTEIREENERNGVV